MAGTLKVPVIYTFPKLLNHQSNNINQY